MSSTHATLSRRDVLQNGLAGGLVLAFQWPLRAAPVNEPEQPPDNPNGQFAPNAFIRIDNAGKTTLVIPQAEMGQGVYTAIAMILAEELDADFAQVVIRHAPASDKLYANPTFGIQVTGNSNSIRAFWDKLREAGASARAMLIAAAAEQWQVDAADLLLPVLEPPSPLRRFEFPLNATDRLMRAVASNQLAASNISPTALLSRCILVTSRAVASGFAT